MIICFAVCFVLPCYICFEFFTCRVIREWVTDERVKRFFTFSFLDSEPQMSTTTVHPFKMRSPLSSSKRYKSPENLAKIIGKPAPEVSSYVHCSYFLYNKAGTSLWCSQEYNNRGEEREYCTWIFRMLSKSCASSME